MKHYGIEFTLIISNFGKKTKKVIHRITFQKSLENFKTSRAQPNFARENWAGRGDGGKAANAAASGGGIENSSKVAAIIKVS